MRLPDSAVRPRQSPAQSPRVQTPSSPGETRRPVLRRFDTVTTPSSPGEDRRPLLRRAESMQTPSSPGHEERSRLQLLLGKQTHLRQL